MKLPSLREKAGKSVVTLTDKPTHRRRDFYCGDWPASPETRQNYLTLIGRWESAGFRWPCLADANSITVVEVVQRYWRWAKDYYSKGESESIKVAWKVLIEVAGRDVAEKMHPVRLKDVREAMIRRGWDRKYINKQVMRICAIFRWAHEEQLLPITVYQGLKAMRPLRRGHTTAPEPEPIRPIADAVVALAEPFLSRQVLAVAKLQRLTGARPGELLPLRKCDIDRSGEIWSIGLSDHKMDYMEKKRSIYFGPQAQAVLAPFLLRPDDAYLFCPAEADHERITTRTQQRTTPPGLGHVAKGSRQERGDHYTTHSYRRALERAQRQANRWAQGGMVCDNRAWVIERWAPNQLRHTAATEIRRKYGLEAAQVVLGHSSAVITDAVYAERDRGVVERVMREIG